MALQPLTPRKTPNYLAPELVEYAVTSSPVSVMVALSAIHGMRTRDLSASHAQPTVQMILNRYGGAQSKNTTAVESTMVLRMIWMKYANA